MWLTQLLLCPSRYASTRHKPVPEEVAKRLAREWAKEGGKRVDRQGLMPPRGHVPLPRRWVVERTNHLALLEQRMSKDYQ